MAMSPARARLSFRLPPSDSKKNAPIFSKRERLDPSVFAAAIVSPCLRPYAARSVLEPRASDPERPSAIFETGSAHQMPRRAQAGPSEEPASDKRSPSPL